MKNIKSELKEIEQLTGDGQYDAAKERLDLLTETEGDNPDIWREYAHLYAHYGDHDTAIEYISRVISLRPDEPAFYFTRSLYLINADRPERALDDIAEALRLSDILKSDYYRSCLHLFRAEALYRLGRYAEAIEECELLSEDTGFWFYEYRDKEIILRDCHERLTA